MNLLSRFMRGEGVSARVLRSSSIIALSFAATQAMRLGSNLVLTRILFPEAFGLMALVTVFIVGLQMFSDTGIGPSILQNARGDEPDFLNTAWTLQILRGVVLWVGTLAIAFPAAWLYSEPMLAQLLPVAGIALLIGSFNPTRGETAYRHLRAVRVVLMDLAAQALGILSVILLAWWFESVWALVFGAHVSAVAKLVLMNRYLTGHRDRWHLNRRDALDILHFGKWIFPGVDFGLFCKSGRQGSAGGVPDAGGPRCLQHRLYNGQRAGTGRQRGHPAGADSAVSRSQSVRVRRECPQSPSPCGSCCRARP
jgi:O-antigen/teichoic acid export membrane protein